MKALKLSGFVLAVLSALFIFACGSEDNSIADGDDTVTDGDEIDGDETVVDGDEIDGDEDMEAEEEVEQEQPEEIGCEVDPQSVDNAETVSFDPESVTLDENIFTMLVQSGSMTKESVILWTYAADDKTKRLKVWRESEESDSIKMVFDENVEPEEGYLKQLVTGLAPKTEYYYAFFDQISTEPTSRSAIGHFKTAFPVGCLAPLVIGGTHGTNYGKRPFTALEITATYDLDMFVHLGDYSYNDGAVLDGGAFRDEASIQANRSIWKKTFDDPGLRALLPSVGQYVVRDDHEVCDNSCLEDSEFREEFYNIGMDAMLETLPIEHDGYKLWRSYKWGDTAEIFLLDCRSERDPDSRLTDDALYIGHLQMEWLKESLRNSTAHFKIILNSVPITLFDHSIWLMDFDRWQGYPAQREEILDYIVNNAIENVWWLTGDFHLGSVNRVQSSGPYSSMWEIMMGPGGNDGNPIWPFVNGDLDMFPVEEIVPPQQFDFFYGEKATTIVTFDPIKDTVHVLFFDAETGEAIYDKEISWTPASVD